MFSGAQPRQDVKSLRRFRDCPPPPPLPLQVVPDGLVESKLLNRYQFWFYRVINNILKVGTESAPETTENLENLSRLCARENFIQDRGNVYKVARRKPKTHLRRTQNYLKYVSCRFTHVYLFLRLTFVGALSNTINSSFRTGCLFFWTFYMNNAKLFFREPKELSK